MDEKKWGELECLYYWGGKLKTGKIDIQKLCRNTVLLSN